MINSLTAGVYFVFLVLIVGTLAACVALEVEEIKRADGEAAEIALVIAYSELRVRQCKANSLDCRSREDGVCVSRLFYANGVRREVFCK